MIINDNLTIDDTRVDITVTDQGELFLVSDNGYLKGELSVESLSRVTAHVNRLERLLNPRKETKAPVPAKKKRRA